MSTYLIGDVQGCFDSLQALLQKIHFNLAVDRLGFVGDLVNRGPKSLETLRLLMTLNNPLIVLGNHDLHLMALYFLRHRHPAAFQSISHTLHATLAAPDCDQFIHFLLQKNFLHTENNFVLVHAGIPPQWSLTQATDYAAEAAANMRENPVDFFEHIYGNVPCHWHDQLDGWDRIRYIVNAFTRMRFCTAEGELDLDTKTSHDHAENNFRPWFEWTHWDIDIYFGHWASLRGKSTNPAVFALDTGCAWGEKLTAMRVEDHRLFQVVAREEN